jgi:hypothetical protein
MITRVPPFWRDECTTVIPRTAAFQGNQFRGAFTVVHTSGTQNFADCISMNGKQKAPPLVPTDRANQWSEDVPSVDHQVRGIAVVVQ